MLLQEKGNFAWRCVSAGWTIFGRSSVKNERKVKYGYAEIED